MAKQVYKVTGSREYLGHAPGSVFEVELEPESEARALAAGHITKSTAAPKEAAPVLTAAAQSAAQDSLTAQAAAARAAETKANAEKAAAAQKAADQAAAAKGQVS